MCMPFHCRLYNKYVRLYTLYYINADFVDITCPVDKMYKDDVLYVDDRKYLNITCPKSERSESGLTSESFKCVTNGSDTLYHKQLSTCQSKLI